MGFFAFCVLPGVCPSSVSAQRVPSKVTVEAGCGDVPAIPGALAAKVGGQQFKDK